MLVVRLPLPPQPCHPLRYGITDRDRTPQLTPSSKRASRLQRPPILHQSNAAAHFAPSPDLCPWHLHCWLRCWPDRPGQQNHHMPEKAQAQMCAARQEHPLLGMLLA